MNVTDIVVGGGFVVTGVMLLQHFRKRPNMSVKYRVMSIFLIIIGFALAMWDVMFALAVKSHH